MALPTRERSSRSLLHSCILHLVAASGSGMPRIRATSADVFTWFMILPAKGPVAPFSVVSTLGPNPHSAQSETHLIESTSICQATGVKWSSRSD